MEGLQIEEQTVHEQVPRTREIPLKVYNRKQIEIARDVYARFHNKLSIDTASSNEIMEFWTKAGYSETFRHLVREGGLDTDPTLAGDIENLTADHVLHFVDPEHRQD